MAKKRIFQLARELGVDSKSILAKCRAEGLAMNNHMSTVTIGQEATIREWFTEEPQSTSTTAVETTQKVDLSQAKKAGKKARKKAKRPEPEASTTEQSASLTEAPAEGGEAAPAVQPSEDQASAEPTAKAPEAGESTQTPSAEAPPAETQGEQTPTAETPDEQSPPAEPVAPPEAEPTEQEQPPKEAETTGATSSAEQPAEPTAEQPTEEAASGSVAETESSAPKGQQMGPPQAPKLKGPNVVRVEEPETGKRPAARGSGRPTSPSRKPPRRGGEEERSRSPRRRRGGRREKQEGGKSAEWRAQDLLEREERLSRSGGFVKQRRQDMKKRAQTGAGPTTPAKVGGKVEIHEPITIKDLSAATGIKAADIVKFLFQRGVMATINQTIDREAAEEVCLEQNIELVVKEERTAEEEVVEQVQQRQRTDVHPRPSTVGVLGHVDHGKTSLLDRIRKADVAAREAGGITQHVGAFRATIEGSDQQEKTVVFLDTPGHHAFTTMRARGANLADVLVLVVGADDGVMPQTVESINHAKAAGVTIVVALNKVDKPDVTEEQIHRIYGQLAEHELNPVEWGGQTEVVRVSAETGEGISGLVEVLDFQAELLELTADYAGLAYGTLIEGELDPGRGPIARVLLQEGQLSVGDVAVVGRAYGKVRSIVDDRGQWLKQAGPATPVEIAGMDMVADAGDRFYAVQSLDQAEEIAEQRREKERKEELAAKSRVTLDNVFEQMQAGGAKQLPVVVKADVQGSVEVLRKSLEEQSTNEVRVRVVHAAVGGITESDIELAAASEGVVIGFNVIGTGQARSEAERRGIDVRYYRVIYDVIEDVRGALEGMLQPVKREEVLGHAEVREVFRVTRVGMVAGCYVTDGVVRRNAYVRVTREGVVVEHDRVLRSLKRFKDDAREVRAGMECGMSVEGYDDIRTGDVIECYVTKEERASLSAAAS